MLVESALQLLKGAGWLDAQILVRPPVHTSSGVFRPDIVLLLNNSAVAAVEIQLMSSQPGTVGDGSEDHLSRAVKELGVQFTYTTDGARVREHDLITREARDLQGFPSPRDLAAKLDEHEEKDGLEHTVGERTSEPHLSASQTLAVSRLLDAIEGGAGSVHLSVASGAGSTIITAVALRELLIRNPHSRFLYVDDQLLLIDQALKVMETVIVDERVAVVGRGEWRDSRLALAALGSRKVMQIIQELRRDHFAAIIVRSVTKRNFIDDLFDHFKDATFIAVLPPTGDYRVRATFGPPIFRIPGSETLGTLFLEPPKGFESVSLKQVARLRQGFTPPDNVADPSKQEPSIASVSARDIGPDGHLDFAKVHRIPMTSLDTPSRSGELEHYQLRARDILVEREPSDSRFRVALVPESAPWPIAFSSSLIRVRVEEPRLPPPLVHDFLRSSRGQEVLRSVVEGKPPYLTPQNLGDAPIFIPEDSPESTHHPDPTPNRLAADVISSEILPLLIEEGEESFSAAVDKLGELLVRLKPRTLEEDILERFPTPISLAYQRYRDSKFNVFERVLRLRDLFEAIAMFSYNVVLTDAFRRLDPRAYFVSDSGARRAFNGYSLAGRLDFIDAIAQVDRSGRSRNLFVPELVDPELTSLCRILQNEFRNRLSHAGLSTENQQRRNLTKFFPIVEALLEKSRFWVDYRLVRIPAFFNSEGRWFGRSELYRGTSPFPVEIALVTNSQSFDLDHEHMGLLDKDDRVLDLYPLYQMVASDQTNHEYHLCFFKQRRAKEVRLEGESIHGAFDVSLEAVYGERGRGYIECHHEIPLGLALDSTVTTLDDLRLVCPNCHRMLHYRGLTTVEQLRKELKQSISVT